MTDLRGHGYECPLRRHSVAIGQLIPDIPGPAAGAVDCVLSNHLIHEYEEILKADAAGLGLSLDEIDTLLDAICARAEEWLLTHGWLPILDDPDDEPLVQLAYDSVARRIVTHNIRHLTPARALGIEILPRRQFAPMIPAS